MGLLGRNPIISWVVSVIDISKVKRVLDMCVSTEQQPACDLHAGKQTDTLIHIHHFQVQPVWLICLLGFSVPTQPPHWKQNLALNPSLVNYNPNALHQVCFTHLLWDSWYSCNDYSESSLAYDPGNPPDTENHCCPEILHVVLCPFPSESRFSSWRVLLT